MHDQGNDSHNEQQVNQPARNVECEKAQKPSHQEHDKENEKHTVTTSFNLFFLSLMSSVPTLVRFWQRASSRQMPLALCSPARISPASTTDQKQHQENNQ
jgi:hypothetical protein